jgi:hypothetical protein
MHDNSQFLKSAPSDEAGIWTKRESKPTNHFYSMFAMKAAQNLSQGQAAFATLVANYNGYKWVPSPTATLTLTQSGLLAVLLEHQRYKAIQLAWRRAHRERMRAAFWRTLVWPHARTVRTLVDDFAKPLIRTVPRHT